MFLSSVGLDIAMIIGFLILAYILGSIPFGLVIGKLICHIDIREHGSKNIGSTNAIRVLGKKVGFFVFFMDVFKGMAVIIILKILNITGVYELPSWCGYIFFGVAAILGHGFSIFLKFKGGKVVATSLGVCLILCPLAAILCLIAFLITLYTTGYVSLASTFATLTVLITVVILYFFGVEPTFAVTSWNIGWYFIQEVELGMLILVSLMAVLILVKHRKNYVRLLNGTESNFKKAKKEKKLQQEAEAQALENNEQK